MNTKSLGSILRDWRIESNLSQADLGKAAGLSRRIVGNIERGERKLDNRQVVRLCRALGRGLEELILSWSRTSLEELLQIERELHGEKEELRSREKKKTDPFAPGLAVGGSIEEIIDEIAANLKELYHRAQVELIQKLQLQVGLANASPAPPPAARRRQGARSRAGRKGRATA